MQLRTFAAIGTAMALLTKMVRAGVQRTPDTDVPGWFAADGAHEPRLGGDRRYLLGELGWRI